MRDLLRGEAPSMYLELVTIRTAKTRECQFPRHVRRFVPLIEMLIRNGEVVDCLHMRYFCKCWNMVVNPFVRGHRRFLGSGRAFNLYQALFMRISAAYIA
jgi:hypothetical protein